MQSSQHLPPTPAAPHCLSPFPPYLSCLLLVVVVLLLLLPPPPSLFLIMIIIIFRIFSFSGSFSLEGIDPILTSYTSAKTASSISAVFSKSSFTICMTSLYKTPCWKWGWAAWRLAVLISSFCNFSRFFVGNSGVIL